MGCQHYSEIRMNITKAIINCMKEKCSYTYTCKFIGHIIKKRRFIKETNISIYPSDFYFNFKGEEIMVQASRQL